MVKKEKKRGPLLHKIENEIERSDSDNFCFLEPSIISKYNCVFDTEKSKINMSINSSTTAFLNILIHVGQNKLNNKMNIRTCKQNSVKFFKQHIIKIS